MPRKSDRLRSLNWHIPQLALSPTAHRLGLKFPNCRYTYEKLLKNKR